MPVRRSCALVPAALLALCAPALHAQRRATESDADWLERCRNSGNEVYVSDGERGEQFCDVRVERLRPHGRLAIDGDQNGGIAVRGADDADEVVVHARITAYARTERDAEAVARGVRVVSEGDRVYAEGPERERGRSWYVSYVVETPRRLDLQLTTRNGGLAVSGVTGRMELGARNGGLSLSDVGGDVRARTQNGGLSVRLTGRRWDGAGLDAETRNGGVSLEVPDGYAARLETGTVNGRITTELPITVQGRVGRTLATDIGGGGPPVRVSTTNGSVSIRRPQ